MPRLAHRLGRWLGLRSSDDSSSSNRPSESQSLQERSTTTPTPPVIQASLGGVRLGLFNVSLRQIVLEEPGVLLQRLPAVIVQVKDRSLDMEPLRDRNCPALNLNTRTPEHQAVLRVYDRGSFNDYTRRHNLFSLGVAVMNQGIEFTRERQDSFRLTVSDLQEINVISARHTIAVDTGGGGGGGGSISFETIVSDVARNENLPLQLYSVCRSRDIDTGKQDCWLTFLTNIRVGEVLHVSHEESQTGMHVGVTSSSLDNLVKLYGQYTRDNEASRDTPKSILSADLFAFRLLQTRNGTQTQKLILVGPKVIRDEDRVLRTLSRPLSQDEVTLILLVNASKKFCEFLTRYQEEMPNSSLFERVILQVVGVLRYVMNGPDVPKETTTILTSFVRDTWVVSGPAHAKAVSYRTILTKGATGEIHRTNLTDATQRHAFLNQHPEWTALVHEFETYHDHCCTKMLIIGRRIWAGIFPQVCVVLVVFLIWITCWTQLPFLSVAHRDGMEQPQPDL